MASFSFDKFNDLLKRVLLDYKGVFSEEEAVHFAYIDFINIFCLLNGIRNGIHLDCFISANSIIRSKGDDIEYNDLEMNYMNDLINELTRMSLHGECPEFKYSLGNEITIWDPSKVPSSAVLHSWAFEPDGGRSLYDPYWKNTGILLGNHLGYPTMVEKADAGVWNLSITLSFNGKPLAGISLCGGIYNSKNPADLDSIHYIRNFLLPLIGKPIYNPDGNKVMLREVNIHLPTTNAT